MTETYPRTRSPLARAAWATGSRRAKDSDTVALVLARANASVVAVNIATSVIGGGGFAAESGEMDAERMRKTSSRPLAFGTSTERSVFGMGSIKERTSAVPAIYCHFFC